MSLHIRCTRCSQVMAVGADAAGKQVSCPKCHCVLQVPGATVPAPTAVSPAPPVKPVNPTPPAAVTPSASVPPVPPVLSAPTPIMKLPASAPPPVPPRSPVAVAPRNSPASLAPAMPLTMPRRRAVSRPAPRSGSPKILLTLIFFVFLAALAAGGTILVLNQVMSQKGDKGDNSIAQKTDEEKSNGPTEQPPPKNPDGGNPTPVDPPKTPVDPPKNPVDPPKNPVDPPKNPVDPPKNPVDPPKNPVDPPKNPVDPPKTPVDPPKDPIKPNPDPDPLPPLEKDPKQPPLEKDPKQQTPPDKEGPRLQVLDDFGNPLEKVGLVKEKNEFKGGKILVWCGSMRDLQGYFNDSLPNPNPMWDALTAAGFKITRRTGKFPVELLKDNDQLWIISSPHEHEDAFAKMVDPGSVPMWVPKVKLNPGETPEDWTKFLSHIVQYPPTRYELTDPDYQAIFAYVKSGKGLFLLADNDPLTVEANIYCKSVFGTEVKGDYKGTKIAYVSDRKENPITKEMIDKYAKDESGKPWGYAVKDHALLTGVNFMYEGITISHFLPRPNLAMVMANSEGKGLIGVSTIAGQRVVVDCGCTRYWYGTSRPFEYINKTAGTVRFAENVAAYLMGKGKQ